MYNCLSCVVQQASFTPVSVGWWILCRSCHCLYTSQTCLALSGHGGRQGETKCMFMIALHQLFLFLVINRHCPCTCIFIRAAAGLVSLICQSSEMLQFDFTLLSFLPVFILAGVLCKLHAHHGQYLAPRKVRTTQEGVCFRDGQRAWSPPLWPCAKKTKRCIQCCWGVFFLQIITDDDVDRISLCVRVVAERVPLMKNIFTVECRNSLSSMLDANKRGEEEKMNKVRLIYVTFTRERGPNQRKTVDNSE